MSIRDSPANPFLAPRSVKRMRDPPRPIKYEDYKRTLVAPLGDRERGDEPIQRIEAILETARIRNAPVTRRYHYFTADLTWPEGTPRSLRVC